MRILVGLIEHMGDIVASEPVVRYLKAKWPRCHITWVVATPYREIVDANPFVDYTIAVDCLTDWIKLSKHSDYDKVVDLHVNYRICQHCNVPLIKSTGNPFVSAFEWLDYGALLEAFSIGAGLPKLSAHPQVYLSDEHVGAVDALALPERFCVVHRESNSVDKDWVSDRWSALARILRDELGFAIVEVGAGRQPSVSPLGEETINLFNRIPILQTAEVIRRASLFIGVDSGPAHLANAVRTPGVVLLGRIGYFRSYMPYTGFYASAAPDVKLVRNPSGPARLLTVDEVAEAVRYVAGVRLSRDLPSEPRQQEVAPGTHARDRDVLLESSLFEDAWYTVHNPDVVESGLDPVDHYLLIGSQQGREPSLDFDAADYRTRYPDVARAGIDPLVHFLQSGILEGRHRAHLLSHEVEPQTPHLTMPRNRAAIAEKAGDDGRADARPTNVLPNEVPRVFAFYLPQFHPIPENDWAHGPGFTEWNNVVKAKPLFPGHYQPRQPGELGFYDLRSEEVMRSQLSLALEHGIEGFCFYYYYFQGRKLLNKPLENYVRSDMKAPFFLLWANENWSKRWDGGDREVIIAQQHSREDDLAFLNGLVPLFRDERYVKVGGKPILMIYKTHLFPDITQTVEVWREEILRHGFPGLYLVMVDDWISNLDHPRQFGFDATYEIPSNVVPQNTFDEDVPSLGLADDFEGRIIDYRQFARYHAGRPFPSYKRLRTVMLPWDNTARYGSRAMVHRHGNSDAYRLWLQQALLDTHRRYEPDERIVFLHSWNEWCEGTYLEPDGRFGRFFLEETRRAVETAREAISGSQAVSTDVMASVLQTQDLKDEGAYRVLQAMRLQNGYAWNESERLRQTVRELEEKLILLELRAKRAGH